MLKYLGISRFTVPSEASWFFSIKEKKKEQKNCINCINGAVKVFYSNDNLSYCSAFFAFKILDDKFSEFNGIFLNFAFVLRWSFSIT